MTQRPLQDRTALVAGATRGGGRGIALALGEAGATVYCTGRSTRDSPATEGRPETIEETAEMVTARGGEGLWMRVDHTDEGQVAELAERVREERGRLDVLVNCVWGGDALTEWGTPFWELSLEKGRTMLERAVVSHIVTARRLTPLILETGHGLIVEVTDGDSYQYRGNLFYDLVKTTVIRLAFDMAWELRRTSSTALAVTPGFLRSEAMLEHFGVTEDNWRDAGAKDPHFLASESPLFVGRAIAALAADPQVERRAGRVYGSWSLARDYGFTDADGGRPDWGAYFSETFGDVSRPCDDGLYQYWTGGAMEVLQPDWP